LERIPTLITKSYQSARKWHWSASTPVLRLNEALSRELSKSSDTRMQIETRNIVVTNIIGKPLAEEIERRFRINGDAVRIAGVQED
jgi:hypothetical protein